MRMVYGRIVSVFLAHIILLLISLPVRAAVPVAGQSVTLAWTPSQASTVAGYRLYYGGASDTYTNIIEVGNATSVAVSNLAVGGTYFFAATAYDVVGLESPFSREISYTIPAYSRLSVDPLADGKMLLTARGPAGYRYDIQTSSDFQNWAAAANATMDVNGFFQFTDSGAVTNPSKYYRLKQTSP